LFILLAEKCQQPNEERLRCNMTEVLGWVGGHKRNK